TAPYSLMMTAVPRPSGVDRKRRTRVVLPAPRKPVTTVTGMRAPRARFCRRPKGPASRDWKRSSAGMAPEQLRALDRHARHTQSSLRRLRKLVCAAGHPRLSCRKQDVDGRDKPGHDDCGWAFCQRKPRCVRSEIHLQDVEPAREAVDRVDDLALVD